MARGRPRHDDILTRREWQVMALLREHLTNEQIAGRLGIAPNTVKFHVSEILSKLGLESREQAAAWGEAEQRRRGLLAVILGALPHKAVLTRIVIGAGAATAIAAVVLIAVALGGKPDATSSTLGKIAYVQDGNLWVKDLDSGQALQLTSGGSAARPVWSPSGEWLLFQKGPPAPPDQIGSMLIRDDGSGLRRLGAVGLAAWSPIDDVLALALEDSTLAVENADGSGRRELLGPVPERNFNPLDRRDNLTWSSDGRWIVFEEDHADHQRAAQFSYVGVRAVRLDGSGEHELYAATLPPPDSYLGIDTLPARFADYGGGATANVTLSGPRLDPPEAGGLPTNLVAHVSTQDDGAGVRLFTGPDSMAMSPNGRELALVQGAVLVTIELPDARMQPVDAQTGKSIAVMDLQSGGVRTLTASDVVAVAPSWSPDGQTIAYVARPDTGPVPALDSGVDAEQTRRIWMANSDGSNAHPLRTDGADCRQERPLWSSDGGQVLFACLGTEPEASLWLAPASGGAAKQVVAGVSLDTNPAGVFLRGYRGQIGWEMFYDWWRP